MNTNKPGTRPDIAAQAGQTPAARRVRAGSVVNGAAGLLALAIFGIASVSFAVPPYQPDMVAGGNKWSFRAYNDAVPNHTELVSAQGICFEYAGLSGNHQLYTWYSDTFPGWSGTAVQNGDQIFLRGDYAKGAGHSSIQIETLVNPPIYGSAGYWQEWRHGGANGVTIGFATTRALREGDCTITAKQAAARTPLLTGDPLITNVTP